MSNMQQGNNKTNQGSTIELTFEVVDKIQDIVATSATERAKELSRGNVDESEWEGFVDKVKPYLNVTATDSSNININYDWWNVLALGGKSAYFYNALNEEVTKASYIEQVKRFLSESSPQQ